MTERRYTEEEVAAIFQRATEAEQSRRQELAPADGMTLAQLQEIGQEVGIAPALVAQAAHTLGRHTPPSRRTFLGLPIGVGRTIELHRKLSDEEWDRLVVDLRETFDARGTVRQEGSFRQWTNGNLQALLEPSGSGHRLRLRTVRAASRALMSGGITVSAVGVLMTVVATASGVADPLSQTFGFLVAGVGLFAAGALRLPGWARERRRQMEGVAERLALAVTSSSDPELPSGS